jgi:hypothetical protein
MAEQNILNKFASFNSLWSMAAVPKGDFNSGSYRKQLDNLIFSSAGRYDGNRVPTAYGKPEYFINNVEMETYVTPTSSAGNTNQMRIDFDIFEPFSMGLFLQSCQVAAKLSGYASYLDDCPYVLQLDIKGQSTTNEFDDVGPYFFCVRLKKVSWTTNEAGSTYRVETIPYGDIGYNQSSNNLNNDMKLVGKGAYESLVSNPNNSFVTMLNEREAQLVKQKKKKIPNKYTVVFPDCDWGGSNPYKDDNNGGNFDFQADTKGGTEVHKRAGDVYGPNAKILREKVTINPREKTLQLSKDTSLTNCIDSVIVNTRHARETATGAKPLDNEGNLIWWRTDIDVKLLDYDETTKENAKEFVFRVVPFKVHHTLYMAGNATAQGTDALRDSVAKRYYYIYTGLNTEVLKWEIKLENLFFTAVDANSAHDTGTQQNPGANDSVDGKIETTRGAQGRVNETEPGGLAPPTKAHARTSKSPVSAGAGRMDTAQKVASEFYANVLNHVGDMVNLDLEVMGDPYWLPTAGQPNVHPTGGGSMTNADGTMNYENRDIFVEVIFKTPLDVFDPADGLYFFQDGDLPSPFSGIYRLNKVMNYWKDGNFTQKLEGNRMPAQDLAGGGELQPTVVEGTQAPKTSVFKSD